MNLVLALTKLVQLLLSHGGVAYIAHTSVEVPTLKRYSRLIARLITFVLRCNLGWKCRYSMALTDAQTDKSSKLVESLNLSSVASQALDKGDPLEDLEMEEDEEDLIDYGPMHDEALGRAEISQATLSLSQCSNTDVCLLELLSTLFMQLPKAEDDKFSSPIIRFLVLDSYQRNGSWLPSRRITEIISNLAFCGRSIMFYQATKTLAIQKESRYST